MVVKAEYDSIIMSTKIIFFILIIAGTVLEVFGDVLFKKWVVDHRNLFFWTGFTIYAIDTLFWAYSLKYETLSKAIAVFTILNLIIIVLVGVIFFKENLTLANKIGIVLGVLSILLMEIG